VDVFVNLGKLIGLLGLFLLVKWRHAATQRNETESDRRSSEAERELDVVPQRTGGDGCFVPWGIASGLRDAVPKRTVIVGRMNDRYVRCEELTVDGRQIVRSTEIDRDGNACGIVSLCVGSLDEKIRKLI
jgi:hypothetical protein